MSKQKLEQDSFIIKAPSVPSNNLITLQELTDILEAHEGLFVVDNTDYDDVLYCGTDNLYFSYCFNHYNTKAMAETLLIVEKVIKVTDTSFTVVANGVESFIYLKE